MKLSIGTLSLALWAVTIAVGMWFFVVGSTKPGTDGRTEILLGGDERDLVLGEMRHLLKAVHGILSDLGAQDQHQPADREHIERAARAAGMGMAADVNPVLMEKLPLAFKQMGMSIHRDMDALADAVAQKESSQQILQRLSSMTARCTTCHDMYRFSVRP